MKEKFQVLKSKIVKTKQYTQEKRHYLPNIIYTMHLTLFWFIAITFSGIDWIVMSERFNDADEREVRPQWWERYSVAEIVTERSRGARDLGERDSKKCCKSSERGKGEEWNIFKKIFSLENTRSRWTKILASDIFAPIMQK